MRSRSPWATALAWCVIYVVLGLMVARVIREREVSAPAPGEIRVGSVDISARLTVRLMVAFEDLGPSGAGTAPAFTGTSKKWANGPVSMRLARSILLACGGDRDGGVQEFNDAWSAVHGSAVEEKALPLFRVVHDLLEKAPAAPAPSAAAAPAPQLQSFARPEPGDEAEATERMGVFVEAGRAILLHDPEADRVLHEQAERSFVAIILLTIWGAIVVLGGLAAAITLGVLSGTGRIRSRTGAPRADSGILAELFAGYLVVQYSAGELLSMILPEEPLLRLSVSIAVVLSSLFVLAWAPLRGMSWKDLRDSLGLRAKPLAANVLCGGIAYALGVVLLLVGLGVSLGIGRIIGAEDLGNPSHPIHRLLASHDGAMMALTLFLATVVAPIVEETFFRGALYRHLRDSCRPIGAALSVAVATIVSSLIFGGIHPQGLLFAPVLAGLGAGFCLIREWRGSLLPGMVGHGLNNGLMLGLFLLMDS